MNTFATLRIALQHDLSTELLDELDITRHCPGFNLWAVTARGARYLVAADGADSVGLRLFFRARFDADREDVLIEPLGPNPDRAEWVRLRA